MEQSTFQTLNQLQNAILNVQKLVDSFNRQSEMNAACWAESNLMNKIAGSALQWESPHLQDADDLTNDRWQAIRQSLTDSGLDLSYWFVTATPSSHVWSLINPFISRECQIEFQPNSSDIAGYRYQVLEQKPISIFTSQLFEAVLLNQA